MKPLASPEPTQFALDFGAQDAPPPKTADGPRDPNARLISFGGNVVEYTLKRGKRRTIGFTIDDRGLSVSAPRWVLLRDIEQALHERQRWILDKLAEWQARRARMVVHTTRWEHGTTLPYLGRTITVALGSGTPVTRLQLGMFNQETLLLALPEDASEQRIKDTVQGWLQTEALRIYAERIPVFEQQLGVKISQLKLSSASTRWGSATSDGKIRLHWRLVHFGPDVIDYVIAHELAHLREMNHSPRFWQVVESVLPGFEQARRALRDAAQQPLPQF
ncbi:MAG TPA: SprT family zinc-dependent metalloprotease [Burkholderiaceae bacterium]|nr:SprT family zinc-dependent metalloprotease [Burkholderiaceae bacterium]